MSGFFGSSLSERLGVADFFTALIALSRQALTCYDASLRIHNNSGDLLYVLDLYRLVWAEWFLFRLVRVFEIHR